MEIFPALRQGALGDLRGFLFRRGGLFFARGAGLKLKGDLAVIQLEIGGEGFAFFADEARDEVGFPNSEDFFYLLAGNFFLAKSFAHAEFAFANIRALPGGSGVVDRAGFANGALSDRGKLGKIQARGGVGAIAEVEALLALGFVELDDGVERAAELRAEAFERADAAFGKQFFDFLALELSSGHVFPNDRAAFGAAFESLERFLESGMAAFRARDFEVLETSGDEVALEGLGFFDNVGREGPDFLHEAVAVEAAVFHLLELEFPLAG